MRPRSVIHHALLLTGTLALTTLGVPSAQAAVPTADGPAITITGSGWGHSVGMSQYGARSMARQNFTGTQILEHYYPGTVVQPDTRVPDTAEMRVNLAQGQSFASGDRLDLSVVGGQDYDSAPTSPVTVTLGGSQPPLSLPNGPAHAWSFSHDQNTGEYVITDYTNGPARQIARVKDTSPVVVSPAPAGANPGVLRMGQAASSSATGTARYAGTYKWGNLEVASPANSSGTHPTNVVTPILVQPLQNYLWGIAEVPSSWEPAALEAQAIAARTYAGAFTYLTPGKPGESNISGTPSNQAYAGYLKERADSGEKWVAAVNASSGKAVTYQDPSKGLVLATTYYSSSHGLGRSENSEDSWAYSSAVPYLRSVDDPYSMDPSTGNPYITWTATASNKDFAAVLGLARVNSIAIVSRTAGGSPQSLQVSGWTPNGNRVSCEWSGVGSCPASNGVAKGAGAKLRTTLPLLTGGSGGRLRSQQILSFTVAPFSDDEASVHQFNIGVLAAAAVTGGCSSADPTLFCPSQAVTRGQMAAFLRRALKMAVDPSKPTTYTDTADSPFRTDIDALTRAGTVGGFADSTFRPELPVTREQMATFLTKGFTLAADGSGSDRFTDIAASTHRANINSVAAGWVAAGCSSSTFCPTQSVTREQMASFLARALGLGD